MSWSKDKNKFYFIIIIVLVVILLLQKCGGDIAKPTPPSTDTVRTTDTSYITLTKEVPKYIPKWRTKIEYIHDTTIVIDTAYVIGDYYSTYYYQDSLIADSLRLYINDSITQNKIKLRDIKYKITIPVISNTLTIIQRKNEFYAGVGLVGSQTGINYFGSNLLLRTKNKNIYGVGIGIDGNFQPQLNLSTYWNIHGRK
jgi:hypothetical protein